MAIEPDCSTGNGPIGVDVVLALLFAGPGIPLTVASAPYAGDGDFGTFLFATGLTSVALGVLATASAVHGVKVVNECGRVRDRWNAQRKQREAPSGAGFEGSVCRTRIPACEPGLACASGFCVVPPAGFESDDVKRERDRKREVATALATKAREAATADDCAMVRTLEAELRAVDVDVHAKLVANPAIRACLEAASAPVVPDAP